MAPYDIPNYLLDRANIIDTAKLMYQYFDLSDFDSVEKFVFAPEITVDYRVLFGGEIRVISRDQQVAEWKVLREKIKDSQHLLSGITTDLPQPGETDTAPTTAQAVGNGQVFLGSFKDNSLSNKGRMFLGFTKISGIKGNPWRISSLRVEKVWMEGSFAQLGQDYEESKKEADKSNL